MWGTVITGAGAATPPVMIEQFSFDEFRPKSWSQVRSETWCMFIFKKKKKEKETFIVLFTLNLSLGVRLSARSSNVMSWVIWGGVFTGNNMNSIVIVSAKSAKKTDGFSCPHQQNLCSPARGAFLQHCPHAEYVNSVERSLFWHHRVY